VTARPAAVRFYIDADLLGLGKLLGTLRNDVTYPGDPGHGDPQTRTIAVPDHQPGRPGR
jgi:hypothetical protein